MKGWKIILISAAVFISVMGSGIQKGPMLGLIAVCAGAFGIILTLAELLAKITKKPFSWGLVVLFISFTLFGLYLWTKQVFFGVFGASLFLIGLAMWLHQRQKEDPKYQESERRRKEEELQRQRTHEQMFTIKEVRLIGGYSQVTRDRFGGAILGYLLGGHKGSLVGAILGQKQVEIQRFRIKYTSGRSSTEDHPVGTKRYRELMRYVKDTDLL